MLNKLYEMFIFGSGHVFVVDLRTGQPPASERFARE